MWTARTLTAPETHNFEIFLSNICLQLFDLLVQLAKLFGALNDDLAVGLSAGLADGLLALEAGCSSCKGVPGSGHL